MIRLFSLKHFVLLGFGLFQGLLDNEVRHGSSRLENLLTPRKPCIRMKITTANTINDRQPSEEEKATESFVGQMVSVLI